MTMDNLRFPANPSRCPALAPAILLGRLKCDQSLSDRYIERPILDSQTKSHRRINPQISHFVRGFASFSCPLNSRPATNNIIGGVSMCCFSWNWKNGRFELHSQGRTKGPE